MTKSGARRDRPPNSLKSTSPPEGVMTTFDCTLYGRKRYNNAKLRKESTDKLKASSLKSKGDVINNLEKGHRHDHGYDDCYNNSSSNLTSMFSTTKDAFAGLSW